MLSFALTGGYDAVKRFLPRLKLAHLAARVPWALWLVRQKSPATSNSPLSRERT